MIATTSGQTPPTNGCMLSYGDLTAATASSTTNSYPPNYIATSASNVQLEYHYGHPPTGGQPSSCSSYNYLSAQDSKLQIGHNDISIPTIQQQPSPPSYYSPPNTMQVPVEGTISTADCHYNYYGYGVSPSPSHPHTSPLSSHHSSPVMRNSPPLHSSVAAMHSPLI